MIKFAFSELNGNELFNLARRTDEIISSRPVKEMGIELYYLGFKKAIDYFSSQMNNFSDELISLHDKAIERADYCQAFFQHVGNYLCYPDEELREQVKKLLNVITRFNPDIHGKCCRTETVVLQAIIGRIELEYKDLLVEIKASEWFDLLKKAQVDFEKLLKEQTVQNKENDEFDTFLNSQPELISSLKRLFTFLPMQYALTANEQLGEILEQLKVEFDKF